VVFGGAGGRRQRALSFGCDGDSTGTMSESASFSRCKRGWRVAWVGVWPTGTWSLPQRPLMAVDGTGGPAATRAHEERRWPPFIVGCPPALRSKQERERGSGTVGMASSRIIKALVQTHHTHQHGPFKLNIFNPKLNYGYFNCRSSTVAKVNRLE
jgi:hypothetical protein